MIQFPKNDALEKHGSWANITPSQLYHLKPPNHHILCFKAEFEANDPSFRESLLPKLSPENREKVLRLRKIQDQNRSIISCTILDLMLKQFGCDMSQLETNEFGKPYLNHHALEFNLSHSGNIVLLAISSFYPIGVDVEKIEVLDDYDSFMQIFHSSEITHFQTIKREKNDFELMKIWTHKEAISKALGLGLQIDMNMISLNHNDGVVKMNTIPSRFPQAWSLHTLHPSHGYIGAIAVPCSECEIHTYTIDISQFN